MRTIEPATKAAPAAPARAARLSAWIRRHGVVLAALAMVVGQLAWKASVLRQAYFTEDDFVFVGRAFERPPDWAYLMRQHDGQLMPGGFLLAWMLARWATYDWGVASAVTLTLVLAASLAMLRMLRLLFGTRAVLLLPFGVCLFTPLALPATAWWAASLNALPLQIALPMAVCSHVTYLRTESRRHALAAAAWVVFGLAFFLKGVGVPLLLFALTSAYVGGTTWRRGAVLAVRRYAFAWRVYVLVLGIYTVVYAAQRHTTAVSPTQPGLVPGVEFTGKLIGWSFVPGALGGPWRWRPAGTGNAVVDPPAVLLALAWLLAALVVAVTIWYRRRAARAWLILLGWLLVVDAVPTAVGRLAFLDSVLGLTPRYLADAVGVLALCLALALLPLRGEVDPYRKTAPPAAARRAVRLAAVGTVAAFGIGTVWSTAGFADQLRGEVARGYIAHARTALATAPPDTQIFDSPTPAAVLPPLHGDYSMTSRVLGPLADARLRRSMREGTDYSEPFIFDEQGRLRPMTVQGVTTAPGPVDGCGYLVQAAVTHLPLTVEVFPFTWAVRIGYLASGDGVVEVSMGAAPSRVHVHRGLGSVYLPLQGGGPGLALRVLTAEVTLCVGDAQVGVAVPREE